MRLSRSRMYERFVAGDPSFDGRFVAGVLTTGIYCLPSCRARKPKPENVRFYPTCQAARAGGFRPCRKCHPDDFARGADPVRRAIEELVSEVRSDPARFPDVAAIVRRSGFGTTRAFELIRRQARTTPGELLARARVGRAKELLLATRSPLAAVAGEAGFASLSTFHRHFRRLTGRTPGFYRRPPRGAPAPSP